MITVEEIKEHYKGIFEPLCVKTLQMFKIRPGIGLLCGSFAMLFGVTYCALPLILVKFSTFTHVSLIVTTIFGFYVYDSRRRASDYLLNKEEFFIGILCVYVGYILSSCVLMSKRFSVLLPIIMIYLPFIDISFECKFIAFAISCAVFTFLMIMLNRKLFIVTGATFTGSCLITMSFGFLNSFCERERDFLKECLNTNKTSFEKLKYFFGKRINSVISTTVENYLSFYSKDSYLSLDTLSLVILVVSWIVAFCFNYFVVGIKNTEKNKDIEDKHD